MKKTSIIVFLLCFLCACVQPADFLPASKALVAHTVLDMKLLAETCQAEVCRPVERGAQAYFVKPSVALAACAALSYTRAVDFGELPENPAATALSKLAGPGCNPLSPENTE